jgi:GT2 family glycosyltransferase/glycosyltransferase involved in cell wall biosynthesis
VSYDVSTRSSARTGVVEIGPGERLDVKRGSPVVVVPVYGAPEFLERCLRSVLQHTAAQVPVLVADDATPDESTLDVVRRLTGKSGYRPIHFLRQPRNLGFPENVNVAFAATDPGDVVLLNSDCEVGPEWLERLRAATYSDTLIATATALTNNGTILSVPRRDRPDSRQPTGHDTESAARAVAANSLLLRPRIPTAIGHCFFVRRSALELVGYFDPAFTPGYGEEVDFSQRCAMRGLVHVAADDVYVYHAGGASLSSATKQRHETLLAQRYPEYHWAVATITSQNAGPLERALTAAEVALTGLTVTIDARCLGPTVSGTQVAVIELIRGLARTSAVRLRAVVSPAAELSVLTELSRIGVEVIRSNEIPSNASPSAIIHRPYQVAHVSDLPLLDKLGRRLIVTQLDLISYRTPGYARSPADLHESRRLTRSVLATADAVLFISRHAADDALADELVDPSRAHVVYLGVDNPSGRAEARPRALPAGAETAFLLYVGTDFRHKNRLFALQVFEQLELNHGWNGHLVFAGPHASLGTSLEDEREFLESRPDLAGRVISLGAVSEAEKAWLYRRTAGVLYPTVYEGFGLIPFEASSFGRPCFFAPQTSLAETLTNCATLVPWDPSASADAVFELLSDDEKSWKLTDAIAEIGTRFSWTTTAAQVVDVYREVLGLRSRDIRLVDNGATAESIAISASPVVDIGLSALERRALLSVLARRPLRWLVLTPLTFAFSVGFFLKHRRLPSKRGIEQE